MSRRQRQHRSGVSPLFQRTVYKGTVKMTPKEFVFDFVKKNPDCNQGDVLSALSAQGVSRPKARKAIKDLCENGVIDGRRGLHNRFEYKILQESYEDDKPQSPINEGAKTQGRDFLYGIGIVGERPIKIGITRDLRTRLITMQVGSYKTYYIAFAVLTESPLELEKELHEKFAAQRMRGEWFDIDQQDLINAIAELKV